MATQPGTPPVQKKRSNDRGWRIYAAGAVAVLVLVFVIQNSQKVEVDFVFANTSTPLFFVIVISVALGALIGWLFPHVRRDRRRERSERDRYDKPKD
jgi:uncharacterized integral membrane protein